MFTPKNNKPIWEMIFNGVVNSPVGTVITFSELSAMINGDVTANRGSVYKASKRLLKDKHHELVTVRGVGYRVVEGIDIMYNADGRHDRAKRQIKMAGYETSNIDVVKLSPDERKRLQEFMSYNANIRSAFMGRIERIEKANQVTQIAGAFTENEISQLRELLSTK